MGVHVACKNEDDTIKREGMGVVTTFLPFKVNGDFQDVEGQLTQKSVVRSC